MSNLIDINYFALGCLVSLYFGFVAGRVFLLWKVQQALQIAKETQEEAIFMKKVASEQEKDAIRVKQEAIQLLEEAKALYPSE